jgi:hypothetical protein
MAEPSAISGRKVMPRSASTISISVSRLDADTALITSQAAAVALRPVGAPLGWEPSLDDLERCAHALAGAPGDALLDVIRAFLPYHDALTMLGLSDAQVVAGDLTPAVLRRGVRRLAVHGAALPLGAVGFAVNGPAAGLVWAAGRLRVSAPMRGTARLLTGLAALLATWTWLRHVLARRGWRAPSLSTLAAGPGCGLVALGLAERLRALRSARVSVARLREHATVVPTLTAQRAALTAAVRAALARAGAQDVRLPGQGGDAP